MKQQSLNRKISLILLWLAVVSFIIIVLVTGWSKVLEVRNEYAAAMRARINIAASLLGRTIFQHDSYVKKLILQAGKEPIAKLLTCQLENLHFRSRGDHFYVLDRQGKISLISEPYSSYKGLDFNAVLPQPNSGDRLISHHQSLLTKRSVVSLVYPLPNGLRLVVEQSLDNIVSAMGHFEAGKHYSDELFFLLSSSGQVVYHPDRKLVKSRHNIAFEMKERTATDDDGLFSYRYHGVDYLASSLKFPSLPDWTLYCSVPSAEMINAVKEAMITQVMMLIVLFGLFFMILQSALNRFFSRPISRIVTSFHDPVDHESPPLSPELAEDIEEFHSIIEAVNTRDAALFRATNRFQAVLNNLDAVVYVADMETHKILFVNSYLQNLLGKNPVGQICYRTLQKNQAGPCDLCTNHQLLDAQGNPARVLVRESQNSRDHRWYECRDQAIPWTDGRLVRMEIATDITARKQAEEEKEALKDKLSRSQKMEAIGLMAGGVAHDLNNILSGIISYPELLLLQLPEDSELRQPISAIQQSGQRAAAVVADLLTVARGVAGTRVTASLNHLVTDYLASPEHEKLSSIYSRISWETNLNPDLLNISCSPMHVQKCLMNLMGNGAEAVNGKGKITIATQNQHVDPHKTKKYDLERGDYAVLSVSDTGPGIAEKDMEHIFEPFYSKKIMGRSGTGLGLTVVWNTMQDHGGAVTVDSSPNGTTFKLYFPATDQQIAADEESVKLADLRGNGERILVVDDQEQQRDIATKILESLGYRVDAVASGEKAIEFLQKKSTDLLLLDMIMDPGINGRQTYQESIRIKPGQKAVIASGYSKSAEVKKAFELGASGFIKKPYSMEELGIVIQQELQKKQPLPL